MNADERLRKLICEIENCLECYEEFKNLPEKDRIRIRRWYNRDPWFFPPCGKVKGFFGTGEVFLVCERPSTGTFPSNADKLFYKFIEKYGLEDAHITDLIKCRLKVTEKGKTENKKEADNRFKRDAKNCFKHLLEELKILKPEVIVAVGKRAHGFLNDHLPAYKNRLYQITHYSYALRYKKTDRLERDIKAIKGLSVKN